MQSESQQNYKGVFATVIFRAPKWMHLRYTLMIHNALVNLPDDDWVIQLFLNRPWVDKELLPWHPGLQRLFQHPRIIVTDLPTNLTTAGVKPKHIMASPWLYRSLVADSVLFFSANGAFCGNHPNPTALWEEMRDSVDYCGAPWRQGRGGDGGSHSFRNRTAVLEALEYARRNDWKLTGGGTEYGYLIKIIAKMNQQEGRNFRLATPEQTNALGGVYNLSLADDDSNKLNRLPLVVSGTQARLQWSERDSLLKHCPEIKMIFPSLHEPACFGAHPDGPKCRATICALQEDLPSHGC